MLREVKYLTYLDVESIPQSAVDLYGQNDTLWKYHVGLEIISAMYNEVRNDILGILPKKLLKTLARSQE